MTDDPLRTDFADWLVMTGWVLCVCGLLYLLATDPLGWTP